MDASLILTRAAERGPCEAWSTGRGRRAIEVVAEKGPRTYAHSKGRRLFLVCAKLCAASEGHTGQISE